MFLVFVRTALDQADNIDKVGMVGVNVSQLDFDDVLDHVFGFFQGFGEEFFHDLEDTST